AARRAPAGDARTEDRLRRRRALFPGQRRPHRAAGPGRGRIFLRVALSRRRPRAGEQALSPDRPAGWGARPSGPGGTVAGVPLLAPVRGALRRAGRGGAGRVRWARGALWGPGRPRRSASLTPTASRTSPRRAPTARRT